MVHTARTSKSYLKDIPISLGDSVFSGYVFSKPLLDICICTCIVGAIKCFLDNYILLTDKAVGKTTVEK